MKLSQEQQDNITDIEKQITVLNEEISKAKGINRKSLIIYNVDKILDLFTELKEYRKLTFKEKLVIRMCNMYTNKGSRSNKKRITKAKKSMSHLIVNDNKEQ